MNYVQRAILRLERKGYLNRLADKPYLKLMFFVRMWKRLDLNDPKTFNEKLQWLKLYDRKPEYTRMVDKYEAKKYVAERIGEEYIIPTLGVWDSFDEIDFEALPPQFVLKTTHDCGGLFICKDKAKLDLAAARAKMEKHLKRDYFILGREWPYKNVKPRIIAESFMKDSQTQELRDYKFFCFGGVPKVLFIAADRQANEKDTTIDFFDMEYNHLPIRKGRPNAAKLPEKPVCFEKMKELAAKLSAGIPHVRVDFYEVDGKVYFGELTFSSGSGMGAFEPEQWDYTLGSWIKLPK